MNPVIKTVNLSKQFGNFTAVDSLNFEVYPGEIFGFLGANGAGKTTAIRMLCGLLKPSSGDAKVAGYDIYRETNHLKDNIGYMSQKFSLYEDLSIVENIRFYGGIYGLSDEQIKQKSKTFIEDLGLESQKNKMVQSLPLGWKQKLAFSIAMMHEPKIVFLDEPTAGVDPLSRRQFWDMIYAAAARKITMFITTHYMDEAEYCDRISIMVDGKMAAIDTPSSLKKQFELDSIDAVFLKLARGSSSPMQ
ncbi:MAG: ABC transporter ATP-binding protein [Saprospiraceae bacterium]